MKRIKWINVPALLHSGGCRSIRSQAVTFPSVLELDRVVPRWWQVRKNKSCGRIDSNGEKGCIAFSQAPTKLTEFCVCERREDLSPIYKLSTGGFRFARIGIHDSFNSWTEADDRKQPKASRYKPRRTWRKLARAYAAKDVVRATEGRSARQRLRPMPNPLSGGCPAEPEPSGEGTANRDPVETAMFQQAIGTGTSERQQCREGRPDPGTRPEQRCSGRRPEGRKSGETWAEARRNRPGPQGLGRNRTGDPPKQRCGWPGNPSGSETRPQGSGRSRSARERKPAFTGTVDEPRESGGWWRHRPPFLWGSPGVGFQSSRAQAQK